VQDVNGRSIFGEGGGVPTWEIARGRKGRGLQKCACKPSDTLLLLVAIDSFKDFATFANRSVSKTLLDA